MKLSLYQFIKNCLPRGIILATIILLVLNLYLIYQSVWQVFTYSKKNLLIQNEVVPIELKTDLFNKIEERLNSKKNPEEIDFSSLENPFVLSSKKIEEPEIEEPELEESGAIKQYGSSDSPTVWTIPAGYKYIPGPSKLIFYTNIITKPGTIHKYGIPK